MAEKFQYIRFFGDIGIGDVGTVGGKNAALGEMYRALTPQGIRVPNGFAITADAYRAMLEGAQAWEPLHAALDGLSPNDMVDLRRRGAQARAIIYDAQLPEVLKGEILAAYQELQHEYGQALSVAVRSSATAEDLPTASFAGQQETFLNVQGEAALIDACKRCFASLFTDRAIHYRVDKGFDHFRVALSIGVMKMVRSDLAASGVMFSLDTESGFRDVVLISAAFGLGENIVQGNVDPDDFYVFKPALERGFRQILRRELGSKKLKLIYARDGGTNANTTRNIDTTPEERERFCLSDAEVLRLADYGGRDRAALQRSRRPSGAHGYGVGQGRRRWRAVYGAGEARNRRLPETDASDRGISTQGQRAGAHHGPSHRQPNRQSARRTSSILPSRCTNSRAVKCW